MKPMLKKRIVTISIIAIFVLLGAVTAFAEKEQKVIRVVYPIQKGLTEIDKNGNYMGYTYDYLKKIAQFTGWKYEFITFPEMEINAAILKSMEMVKNGEADLMGGMLKNDSMLLEYDYPENNYGVVYDVLSALENNCDISESNYMMMDKLRIAVLENAKNKKAELAVFLDDANVEYEEINCKSILEQYSAISENRADLMMRVSLSDAEGTKRIANFAPKPYYFITTKGNKEIVQQLDDAIKSINIAFPVFQSDLFQKHFGDTSGRFAIKEEEEKFIAEKKSINVLCFPDLAPFVFENENKEICGISVSIMNDFAKETNLRVKYEMYNKNENYDDEFASGFYDCVIGIPINEEEIARSSFVSTIPYMNSETLIFSRPNSLPQTPKMSNIALVKNSQMAKNFEGENILFFDTIDECITAVEEKKADCGYGNDFCVEYYMYDNHSTLTAFPVVGFNQEIGFLVHNGEDKQLLTILNKFVKDLDDNDLYDYYAKAKLYGQKDGIQLFIRTNPMAAAFLVAFFAFSIFALVVMSFVSGNNKKRNQQLELANSAKTDFLSRMSHDIRTPMNGIIGTAILAMDEDNPPATREYLKQISSSGEFLMGLVNDILDMTKVESGNIDLYPQPYDYREFLSYLNAVILPLCNKKNLTFNVNFPDDAIPIMMDKLRFNQIFFNLLSNAVKFTHQGGTVGCCLAKQDIKGDTVTLDFIVSDTGIGINESFINKIFEPFTQENGGMTIESQGTGLGLPIVKSLLDKMGGTIRIESKQGVGTKFFVQITTEVAVGVPKSKLEAADTFDEEILIGKHVLLCEDHPLNANIATRLLEKKSVITEHAENGKIALDMFMKSSIGYYDAVLMDIRMPVMDGLKATEEIRRLQRIDAKKVPIIAMTANSFDEDVRQCLAVGMNNHLSKPFEPQKLYKMLADSFSENKTTIN